jgi:phosphoenolpyruvate carboxylase
MTEQPKTPREDRASIRLLGRLLGEVIREQHGEEAFQLVEGIRRQSVGEYRSGEGSGESALDLLKGRSQEEMLLLIRAFSIFSQLANIADDHIARRETKALGSGAAQRMELHPGLTPKRVRAYLKDALFVPVITAHPTEVRRKSILDRENEISELLERRDGASIQTAEQGEISSSAPSASCGKPGCCVPTASRCRTKSKTISPSLPAPSCPACRWSNAAWRVCSSWMAR